MSIRFPAIERELGLGFGLDMPWGEPIGFEMASPGAGPSPRVRRFLGRHARELSHFFFSFQPRGRRALDPSDYFEAYDALLSEVGDAPARALHQTTLNLGSLGDYRRAEILDFTNRCIDRYGIQWINEDVGIWSIQGKSLPYPLPPLLSEAGLDGCIRAVDECQKALTVPLCIEFPGFTEGASFRLGKMDAFEFFHRLATETSSPVTLDTGHILGYQWTRGRRGDELFEELERLPLEHCFEIHLSGCQVVDGRFIDYHHGILMDEQLSLLDRLLERCPNVRAVTYEDPKFGDDGVLIAKSLPGYEKLKERVAVWKAS